MPLHEAWLAALVATLVVEAPLAAALAPAGARALVAATSLCLNLATQPLATALALGVGGERGFWIAELLVVAAELAGYRAVAGLAPRRALAIALVANAATILLALAWAR